MKIIHQVHPEDFKHYTTQQIRDKFLLDGLVQPDVVKFVYTHYDRMMLGVASPINQKVKLLTFDALKSENFLDRREIGVLNIAGNGSIQVDGETFKLEKLDVLYIGKGIKEVIFNSDDSQNPAKFVILSSPAHVNHPTRLMKPSEATPAELGSAATANHRTINKYIHADGIKSCQLVMGVTHFKPGSLWNTMPAHLHDRRSEIYFYFNLPDTQRIIHFMGDPTETRHIFLNNEEGIVSPTWSIHSGTATASYSFIWAMAGENLDFTDMDFIELKALK